MEVFTGDFIELKLKVSPRFLIVFLLSPLPSVRWVFTPCVLLFLCRWLRFFGGRIISTSTWRGEDHFIPLQIRFSSMKNPSTGLPFLGIYYFGVGVLEVGTIVFTYWGLLTTEEENAEQFVFKESARYEHVAPFELATAMASYYGKFQFYDPRFIGGIAVLANHSCSPNMSVVKGFVLSSDESVPMLYLKSKVPINNATELTWDYAASCSKKEEEIVCLCKSKNCKKLLCKYEP